MASSSKKTLTPSVDLKDSPGLQYTALDFPGMLNLANKENIKGLAEIIKTDPVFISIKMGQAFGNPEIKTMMERLRNHLVQMQQKSLSLETLGNPASEQFALCMAHMKEDPELIPILAEIDATGPVALLKFWDDEDALKKLSRAMGVVIVHETAAPGQVEGPKTTLASAGNKDELIAQGRKALQILCEYVKMKHVKVLVDARPKDKKKNKKKEEDTIGG